MRRVHYVLSTHWDREWYQTFQHYRFRLVRLLDKIIDGWQNGDLHGPFQTDGQAIILEDYLEIRPEKTNEIEKYAKSAQLIIGPWYVMPDEFLVSGESLIRNLRMGRQIARRFGAKPSHAGYICDIFGHNSQMPQIFSGFGIRAGFLWRGVNEPENRLFLWQGADGTILPSYRFGPIGYCDYAFKVRHAHQQYQHLTDQELETHLHEFLQKESQCTESDSLMVFDGGDHLFWDPQSYKVWHDASQNPPPGLELIHTSLDAFSDELVEQREKISRTLVGELRQPGKLPYGADESWLIPGVLSSRVWIKQANARCEALLCSWAEPLSAYSHYLLNMPHPLGYLDVAWKWLIQNHPHDSICGCSVDAVHEDMKYRFHQCEDIANRLWQEAAENIAASIEGTIAENNLRLVLFNPLPRPLSTMANVTLQIPEDWPKFNEFFGFEPKPGFRIYDAADQEIAYQRLAQSMSRSRKRIFADKFPEGYKTHDISVCFPVQLPAKGYASYAIRAGEERMPTRHEFRPSLVLSERSMANDFLRVDILENGSVRITDKRSGQIYDRLLQFEDQADIGDGWYHGIASNDQVFNSCASQAQVALVHDGSLMSTFRVRHVLQVPEEFCFAPMQRSAKMATLEIDNYITLHRDADYLQVETRVQNTVKDHRLRVLLPSDAHTSTFWTDTPFDRIERDIALAADAFQYRELEVETRPQQSWTAVFDQNRGLALISTGLYESTVRDTENRAIALTLLRGTRRTVFTDGEPNGQILGEHVFKYWIKALPGKPNWTELYELGQLLAADVLNVQMCEIDRVLNACETQLPAQAGFFHLQGGAVMTSARLMGDYLEIRMFNPLDDQIMATLTWEHMPVWQSQRLRYQPVDLESNPLSAPREIVQGRIAVPVKSKEILTIRLLA